MKHAQQSMNRQWDLEQLQQSLEVIETPHLKTHKQHLPIDQLKKQQTHR